jgi:hypothetical protein
VSGDRARVLEYLEHGVLLDADAPDTTEEKR